DWIVMKALEKDRNRRYETANGFAQDVQRYLADEVVAARPPSAGYRLRKFVRRNRLALAAATALAVAGGGGGGGGAGGAGGRGRRKACGGGCASPGGGRKRGGACGMIPRGCSERPMWPWRGCAGPTTTPPAGRGARRRAGSGSPPAGPWTTWPGTPA